MSSLRDAIAQAINAAILDPPLHPYAGLANFSPDRANEDVLAGAAADAVVALVEERITSERADARAGALSDAQAVLEAQRDQQISLAANAAARHGLTSGHNAKAWALTLALGALDALKEARHEW